MKKLIVVSLVVLLPACKPALSPQALQSYQSRTLYTCCNLRHEGADINDANYSVGTIIPLGSSVAVVGAGRGSITFTADGTKLNLEQRYGRDQESFETYLNKILVPENPRRRLAGFSASVQAVIRDGRVERGMTREQVLMSVGYPPTHRTASTEAREWTYWYNNWVTYKVAFDESGHVSDVIGRPAPTHDQPVSQVEKPTPRPAAPAKRKPARKK